ncbi:MAG: hypothetical protein Q7R78_01245 [bacterium]|nr:hypothetical protein [bacterium]
MNNKNRNIFLTEGFSLLEVVLSIAIGTVIIGSLSSYLFSIKISLERETERANKYISNRHKGFILVPILITTSLISMLILSSFITEQNVIRVDTEEYCKANYSLALDAYIKQIVYLISVYSDDNKIDEKYIQRLEDEKSPETKEIRDIYGTEIVIENIDNDTNNIYPIKIGLEIKSSNLGNSKIKCPNFLSLKSGIVFNSVLSWEIIN